MSKKGSITTSDYLPYDEYVRLVDSLEKDGDYRGAAYCIISFSFGLRIHDVLTIKWGQVLGHGNLVMTEHKTGKTKRIKIGLNTQERLHRLFKKTKYATYDRGIAINRNGTPLSTQYVNKWLKTCKEKYNLKIENFSSHTFRKTLGRYVYEKMGRTEESLILLCRIFRHSNVNITMTYLGLRDDEINGIFEMIG